MDRMMEHSGGRGEMRRRKAAVRSDGPYSKRLLFSPLALIK